jgi:hypothetical protein
VIQDEIARAVAANVEGRVAAGLYPSVSGFWDYQNGHRGAGGRLAAKRSATISRSENASASMTRETVSRCSGERL